MPSYQAVVITALSTSQPNPPCVQPHALSIYSGEVFMFPHTPLCPSIYFTTLLNRPVFHTRPASLRQSVSAAVIQTLILPNYFLQLSLSSILLNVKKRSALVKTTFLTLNPPSDTSLFPCFRPFLPCFWLVWRCCEGVSSSVHSTEGVFVLCWRRRF